MTEHQKRVLIAAQRWHILHAQFWQTTHCYEKNARPAPSRAQLVASEKELHEAVEAMRAAS